jgi:hypothetical protein
MHRDPFYDVDGGLVGISRVMKPHVNTVVMACPAPELPDTAPKEHADFHLVTEQMSKPMPELEPEPIGKANIKITTHLLHGPAKSRNSVPPSIGSMYP